MGPGMRRWSYELRGTPKSILTHETHLDPWNYYAIGKHARLEVSTTIRYTELLLGKHGLHQNEQKQLGRIPC
jgi:hypothetical protein